MSLKDILLFSYLPRYFIFFVVLLDNKKPPLGPLHDVDRILYRYSMDKEY